MRDDQVVKVRCVGLDEYRDAIARLEEERVEHYEISVTWFEGVWWVDPQGPLEKPR